MKDSVFIFFTIFIVAGLIYFLYKIMLGTDKENKEQELQITSGEILEQLNILHRQKKYNIVENLAKKYLEKKGGDDGVRSILTKSLYECGKIYDAIEHAKVIIRHKPDNFNMRIFLANCYVDIEKPMKAINILEEILEDAPDNVLAIKELAKIYFDTNQKKSAAKMYKRLEEFLESNLEKAKNKIIIAKIHTEFREFDLAIKEYEQILEIYPDDVSVKKQLIELCKAISDYDSIIEYAVDLVTTYPEDENGLWAMKTLMDIYQIMQNYEKALEYANLIKTHPLSNRIQSEENIAKILCEEGKINDGIELLKALIVEDPENIGLKKQLAKAYEKNQTFEEAIKIYTKILDEANAQDINQIHFEISSIYSNWAMHSFSQQDIDNCFKYFATAVKYYDQNPEIYYRLGNINQLIKNFNEAISQYKKAIELDSQNSEYYYAISECYGEIDSIYEQKRVLSESLKYNYENAKAHFKLGVVYELQNDHNNAMMHVKKAVELDKNFVEAKHKLALMMEHIGDIEGAIKLYEDILNLEPQNEVAINNLKMLT